MHSDTTYSGVSRGLEYRQCAVHVRSIRSQWVLHGSHDGAVRSLVENDLDAFDRSPRRVPICDRPRDEPCLGIHVRAPSREQVVEHDDGISALDHGVDEVIR